jgi:cytochrome c biogenesis protein CcmG/thiol:disulfide interchange protein DsbE
MKRLALLAPLLLFLGLGVLLYSGIGKDPSIVPSPLIDGPAPEFELPSLTEPEAMLSKTGLDGEAYLLNVWASWCFACRIEHEVVTDLARNGPVPVYGLNWKDQRPDALRWLAQFGNPYRASAYDESGRVGIDFGVYGAPETFLIDGSGQVRYKHVGPLTPEIVQNELLPAINEVHSGGGTGG